MSYGFNLYSQHNQLHPAGRRTGSKAISIVMVLLSFIHQDQEFENGFSLQRTFSFCRQVLYFSLKIWLALSFPKSINESYNSWHLGFTPNKLPSFLIPIPPSSTLIHYNKMVSKFRLYWPHHSSHRCIRRENNLIKFWHHRPRLKAP